MFVNCLVKQFAICLGVFVILLLNVMELLSVVGGALLDRPWSSKECVCCASDHSVRLNAPSICFCMSEVIPPLKSLRAGSQVFALLMLFLCVILHTMWSDKSLQLLCILPFDMLCLSAIRMMFGGYGGLSESGLCVFRELCPIGFLVVGESPSVLL